MIRLTQDNVLLLLEPRSGITQSAGGIHIVHSTKRGARASVWARVLAVGPGHYRQAHCKLGDRAYTEETRTFIRTTVQTGDRVLIDEDAGQDYQLDFSIPRHNVGHEFDQLCGDNGRFRIVRESEVHLYEREEPEATAAE